MEAKKSYNRVIPLDCKRTGFCSAYEKELETLLKRMAVSFPETGYYQGMNCIGGFLLKYTQDFDTSKKVFNFLMEKRLSQYFSHDFQNLKQLFFVSKRIFELYCPRFFTHFNNKNIGTEYFMSPILLTLFSGSLQFIENYSLVADVFDIIFAKGWPGFFQVLVVFISKVEDKLLNLDYDEILNYLKEDFYSELISFNFSSLKREIGKYSIPKSLLMALRVQYADTTYAIDSFWNSYYEKKRTSKRYQGPQILAPPERLKVE